MWEDNTKTTGFCLHADTFLDQTNNSELLKHNQYHAASFLSI